MSRAMAVGVAERLWSMDDLVAVMDAVAPKPAPRGPHKKAWRVNVCFGRRACEDARHGILPRTDAEAGMKRFVEGEDRRQATLLPGCIEDYVSGENPARVIEAFVAALDLAEPGFEGVVPERTGRPACHPSTPPKLHIHGCLDRVRSSRRPEREAGRDLELMWLTGRLAPDFKAIAGFRRDDGAAIRATCRRLVLPCRELDPLPEASVAIGSSESKAADARGRNHAPDVVRRRMGQAEAGVARHLAALGTADRQEEGTARAGAGRPKDRLAGPERRMRRLRELEAAARAAPDGQVSPADPDARAMATSGEGTGTAGHDVQAAAGTGHHLIVAHEATNAGDDRARLSAVAGQASEAMGHDAPTVLAGRGCFDGGGILACTQAGHAPPVPRPTTPGAKADGRFGERDFVHLPEADACRCPAGGTMRWRFSRTDETGRSLRHHWATECPGCPIRARCTPAKMRRITRREREGVLDATRRRPDERPGATRARRRTAERPSGTVKAWMAATRFITRPPKRGGAEMSPHVLAYNLKRVIAIKGVGTLLAAIPSR